MRTGLYISGAGHGVLILWLLFGSLIGWRTEEEKLRVSDVSFISEDDFAALTAPRGEADAPSTPPAPEPVPDPISEPVPVPEAVPEPAPVPEPIPEPPAPEPTPEPEPEPDPIPEPPAPEPVPEPAPQNIPRVAPTPAPEPDPQAEVAPEVVEAPTPSPAPEATQAPDVTPAAPEAATTEIVTEANEAQEETSTAPLRSPRPPARPARPTPPPAPTPPSNTAANAVANAVSDAVAGGQDERPAQNVPEGPPMTRGEKEGLRLAVSQCWSLGTASSDALRTTVVVLVDMDRAGKPTGVRMVDWDGPSQSAADIAYQAARRAILICGRSGYDLPQEKYGQWRQIEMTFNPDKMRIK